MTKKTKQTKKLQIDLRKTARSIALTVVGTLILAFGTSLFILPFDLVIGGMSGMAVVIDALIPTEAITVDLILTVLTWSLFFLGWIILGNGFALKTLVSTIVYPIGVSAFMQLARPDVLDGVFCMTSSPNPELALIISAAAGGAVIGTGCAVTFMGGGSTGGTDVIAFALCRIFSRLKSSLAIFLVDAAVIVSGIFVIRDFSLSLLGILSAMITATVIDKVFLGGSAALVAQVITDNPECVTAGVIERLDRTTTLFEGRGGYSGETRRMVMVTFTMRQYATLMSVIRAADPNAFVTIHRAYEINGEGWSK